MRTIIRNDYPVAVLTADRRLSRPSAGWLILITLVWLLAVMAVPSQGQDKTPAPDLSKFAPSGEWVEKTWGSYTLEIPSNWTKLDESGYGILDRKNMVGVAFRISREEVHVKDMPPDKEGELEELGSTWLAGHPGTGYFMKGAIGPDTLLQAKSICLDDPGPDGKFLVFTGMVVGLDWTEQRAVMERIFSSVRENGSN